MTALLSSYCPTEPYGCGRRGYYRGLWVRVRRWAYFVRSTHRTGGMARGTRTLALAEDGRSLTSGAGNREQMGQGQNRTAYSNMRSRARMAGRDAGPIFCSARRRARCFVKLSVFLSDPMPPRTRNGDHNEPPALEDPARMSPISPVNFLTHDTT